MSSDSCFLQNFEKMIPCLQALTFILGKGGLNLHKSDELVKHA